VICPNAAPAAKSKIASQLNCFARVSIEIVSKRESNIILRRLQSKVKAEFERHLSSKDYTQPLGTLLPAGGFNWKR
jgi:hypothetical protein